MSRSIYFSLPIMFVLAVLQTAVLPYFPIFGLIPILSLILAVGWTLVRSREDGLMWAFVGGLAIDLLSRHLLGINALAFVLAVAMVLLVENALPEGRYLAMFLLTAVGTAVYILCYALLLRLWGEVFSFSFVLALLPLILLHAILGVPIYWVLEKINDVLLPITRRSLR